MMSLLRRNSRGKPDRPRFGLIATMLLGLIGAAFTSNVQAAPGAIALQLEPGNSVSMGQVLGVTCVVTNYTENREIDRVRFDVTYDASAFDFIPGSLNVGAVNDNWLSQPSQETVAQGYNFQSTSGFGGPGLIQVHLHDTIRQAPEGGTVANNGFLISFRLEAIAVGTTPIAVKNSADFAGVIYYDTNLSPIDNDPNLDVQDVTVSDVQNNLDFGDAPQSYPTTLAANGARHVYNSDLRLGVHIDAEQDGQPSVTAEGDDSNPPGIPDDEDGILFLTNFEPGGTASIEALATTTGFVTMFFDWNADGDWDDPGEGTVAAVSGNTTLTVNVPPNAVVGPTFARFRYASQQISLPRGAAPDGEVEDYLIDVKEPTPTLDFGDAPQPYPTTLAADGARHRPNADLRLGLRADVEPDGQPTGLADGDDLNPSTADDEDGVIFPTPIFAGSPGIARIQVVGGGQLDAWADFNSDGDWDDVGEQIAASQAVSGTFDLNFNVPAGVSGRINTRFRLSFNGGLSYTGFGGDGEVEDHQFTIATPTEDFGDAPDSYQTLLASNGARHRVSENIFLGATVDIESDGQPGPNADTDDTTPPGSSDDEDGVVLPAQFPPGQTVSITVFASATGRLNAWMDWNRNGTWIDPSDQIFADTILSPGPNTLTVTVPAGAQLGPSFARFRFALNGKLGYTGAADTGEVEDYQINIGNDDPPCERTNKGLDFWLTFPGNYAPDPDNPVKPSLHIVGPRLTDVSVEIPGLGFAYNGTIGASMSLVVPLPEEADLGNTLDVIEDKGIHVTATALVAVFGMNRVLYTTDGFLGLPSDVLTQEYVVKGFGNVHAQAPPLNGTQFAIVACEDDTTISINPAADAVGHPQGVPYLITLQAGQTYQLRSTNGAPADLTGTVLIGNKPFAAFGGHQCANISDDPFWFCDYVVEQLLPVQRAGTQFAIEDLATRTTDVYRFMAVFDNTTVDVNGVSVATLNRGEFHQMNQSGPAYVTSTRPILTTQYSASSDQDGQVIADPFMIVIPHTGQWLQQYMVCTPDSGFDNNFINIVVPEALIGKVVLDGAFVNAALYDPIVGSPFWGAQVPVLPGVHNLFSSGGTTGISLPFGVTCYGFAEYDSYGFPGGMRFADRTPPTVNCPDEFLVQANPDTCTAVVPDFVELGIISVTDNCPLGQQVQISQNPRAGNQLPGPGTYPVTVTVRDAAGNTSTCVIDVVVVDAGPPIIQCPANGIFSNCDNAEGAKVTFDVTASSPCGTPYEVVCNPPSGTLFRPGITPVNCSAITADGQTASCSFNVTVRCLNLNAGPQAGSFSLDWTGGGTLEGAPTVLGPWTPLPGISPGEIIFPGGVNTNYFYRVNYGR